MDISLTSEQELFVQAKLQIGRYQSTEEMLEIAFFLLDEYERSEAEWVDEVRVKVDAAIEASNQPPLVDGETFVNDILEQF